MMTIVDMKKLETELKDAQLKYENALRRKSGVAQAKETLKNLLLNNLDNIVGCLSGLAKSEEEVACLQAALDDADAELDRLKKSPKTKKGDGADGKKE
jgi:hypothetical protein